MDSASQMTAPGETIEEWRAALDNYELALRTIRRNGAQNADVLLRLDKMIYTHLPIIISSRNPHYITAREYVIIVEWKLRRGRWRPQNLPFARKATDDDVITASAKAFRELEQGKLGEAFDALIPLLGSSPTVASIILSVRDTSVPAMSVELLRATLGNKINFFRSTFLDLVESVKAKARYLSRRDQTRTWTAVDVEKAIFAQAHLPIVMQQDVEPEQVPGQEQEQRPHPKGRAVFARVRTRRPSSPNPVQSGEMGEQTNGPVMEHEVPTSAPAPVFEDMAQISMEDPERREYPRKKRMSVIQRAGTPRAVGNNEREVVMGQSEMGSEEVDEEDNGSDSLYVPRSDPTELDEDSDEDVVGAARGGGEKAFDGRTYRLR